MIDEIPLLPPAEAIAYFRAKGITFGFAWQDVWQEAHARAFTVAKVMQRDLLEDIRAAVDEAIAEGRTLAEFSAALRPTLQAKGWWGRKQQRDPLTGEIKTVQLGSPRRLKTIYRTNMRTAYAAGQWERIDRNRATLPLLRYVSVRDGRERPEHGAWHGTVLPIDHPWWKTHYPPCDWECRCTVQALSERMAERRGYRVGEVPASFPDRDWTNTRTGEVHRIERGIGAGWNYNVGEAALAAYAPAPLPDGFDGSAIASSAEWAGPARRFLEPFGLTAETSVRGRVIIDAGGWPLAVSEAWLQRDGVPALPSADRLQHLYPAGQTLVEPDEIRWVWVRGADGRAMLFRRYVQLGRDGRAVLVVDVGRAGWRFMAKGEVRDLDALRTGTLAWTADEAAIAAANPYQAREPKGSRGGGQFRSTGVPTFMASLASPQPGAASMVRLGNASDSTIALIEKAGRRVRSPAVWLEHGAARHALKRHGGDDRPVTVRDLRSVHQLLNRSTRITPGARPDHTGAPTIRVEVGQAKRTTVAIFAVRRRGLVLTTMHKRGERKGKSPA